MVREDLDRSVDELEISVRSYNHLKVAKITTLGELVQNAESDLRKKKFGKKSISELKEVLGSLGLSLRDGTLEVDVRDSSSSVEDWIRAQRADRAELPELSGDERDVARRFGIGEEEYARGVLAGNYGRERKVQRGRQLGEEVQRILDDLSGGKDRVAALFYDGNKRRWIVTVETPHGLSNVAVPLDLADDILDWGLREQVQQLRSRLAYGLGWEKRARSA